MKKKMMNGFAITLFAAAMSISTSANAAGPNIACTAGLNGQVVYTQSGNYRSYYQCVSRKWVYLRTCPINGGPCFF
jgi:hypothetical protein